jgi:hypothetical protein
MHRLQQYGAPNPSPTNDADGNRKLELVSTVIQKWSKRMSSTNTVRGPAFLIPHRRRRRQSGSGGSNLSSTPPPQLGSSTPPPVLPVAPASKTERRRLQVELDSAPPRLPGSFSFLLLYRRRRWLQLHGERRGWSSTTGAEDLQHRGRYWVSGLRWR